MYREVSVNLLNYFRKLGVIRKHSAFKSCNFSVVLQERRALIYKRECQTETVYVAVVTGGQSYDLTFTSPVEDLISGETGTKFTVSYGQVRIILDKTTKNSL